MSKDCFKTQLFNKKNCKSCEDYLECKRFAIEQGFLGRCLYCREITDIFKNKLCKECYDSLNL